MTRPEAPRPAAAPAEAGMPRTRQIHYKGLACPAVLHQADDLLPLLSAIIRDWPATVTAPRADADPFATLRPLSNRSWQLEAHVGDAGVRVNNPVNTACDFIVELSWERLRSQPDLLCLHAAAVEFNGRLVLFPANRRSGKSTIAAALARLGHRLFTDDFVPVEIDRAERTMRGLANGIAPRLRLPVPPESSAPFRDWVAADTGPANKQYKYLTGAPLAGANAALPLGAVVVLDRQDGDVAPRFEPIAPEEALSRLILQNFARTVHAGNILQSIEALVDALPSYRLVYASFEAAAAFLDAAPELAALDPVRIDRALPEAAPATFASDLKPVATPFDPAAAYVQAPGLTETAAGAESFLADGTGTAIHRLNPGSTVIWRLLEEPMRLDDVVAVMAEAFPGTDPAQIHGDADRTMRRFLAARLIAPAAG